MDPDFNRPAPREINPSAPVEEQKPASAPQPVISQPKGGWVKKFFVILLCLILVGGAIYGVYYWQHQQFVDAQTKLRNAEVALKVNAAKQLALLNKANEATKNNNVSVALPNGKHLVYPLNSTNASVLIWFNQSSDKTAMSTLLPISSTKVAQFISSIDSDYKKTVCGSDDGSGFTTAQIQMFVYDDSKGSLGKNQSANCLAALSSSTTNKAGKYISEAKALNDEVTKDLEAFAKSAKVE